MSQYKANTPNSKDFTLTKDNISIGELKYEKWYTYKAEIVLADNSVYQLEPKGFWNSKIELLQDGKTLLDFELGWKGIVITSYLNGQAKKYLLQLKGLWSSKYLLVDTNEKELLVVDCDLKWNKFHLDFTIETSNEFENFENKELLLLTTLHCINYNIAFINSVS